MGSRKRFNRQFLDECITRDGATLIGEYLSVTRNSDVSFVCKCGTPVYDKNFRQLDLTGAKCESCVAEQKNERREKTCLAKYNTTHASKTEETKKKQIRSFRKNLLGSKDSMAVTNPELLDQWDYDKNLLTPSDYTAGSNESVWWKCNNLFECGCLHEWNAEIYSRTTIGAGCPYCSNTLICVHKSIRYTHPHIAAQWHPVLNGDWTPDQVSYSSDREFWWRCSETCPEGCPHDFRSTVGNRTNGSGCPYCSKPTKKHCVHTSLVSTHPHLMEEFDFTKNTISPETIGAGSHELVWWRCIKGHSWRAAIYSRVSGSGCPHCSCGRQYSKQEIEWLQYIAISRPKLRHALHEDGQFRLGIRKLKLDGAESELKEAYEFHGCFFHGCESCYPDREALNEKTNVSFHDLLVDTREKQKYVESHGYTYCEMWECKWRDAKKAVRKLQKAWRAYLKTEM